MIIVNLDNFNNSFDRLVKNFDAGSKNGLNKASETLKQSIKAEAPVDSGTLRESFEVKKVDEYTNNIQSDVKYAAVIEYGNEDRKPNPFITRGINRKLPNVRVEIIDEIAKSIK